MSRPRRGAADERIARLLKAGLAGRQPPQTARSALLASAGRGRPPGMSIRTERADPPWISASTARRLSDRRHSVGGERYNYMVAATNMRYAW